MVLLSKRKKVFKVLLNAILYRLLASTCASSARSLSIDETAELYDSSIMAILDNLAPV